MECFSGGRVAFVGTAEARFRAKQCLSLVQRQNGDVLQEILIADASAAAAGLTPVQVPAKHLAVATPELLFEVEKEEEAIVLVKDEYTHLKLQYNQPIDFRWKDSQGAVSWRDGHFLRRVTDRQAVTKVAYKDSDERRCEATVPSRDVRPINCRDAPSTVMVCSQTSGYYGHSGAARAGQILKARLEELSRKHEANAQGAEWQTSAQEQAKLSTWSQPRYGDQGSGKQGKSWQDSSWSQGWSQGSWTWQEAAWTAEGGARKGREDSW